MKESAGILQQAKFLALVLKLILVSVIWETRNVHIYASNVPGTTSDSEEFKNADFWFSIVALLFWVLGFIEFLVIFGGNTLFNNQFNLLQIFIHLFGISLLLSFKSENGTVAHFWTNLFVVG